MSQVRDKRQNNVKAGVFVTFSLILGLTIFSILTNAWSRLLSTTNSYHAVFQIDEGVGTLSSGSKVKLGGVLVGTVTSVTPRVEEDNPTSVIDVQFTFAKQYALYENASIHARAGLLGSTGWLSVTDVGNGSKATSKSPLVGTTETMVSQLLGNDAEMNLSKSLDSLRKLSEALVDDGGAMNLLLGSAEATAIKASIDAARSSLLAFNTMMQTTSAAWPSWESSVTTILTDSKKLPAQINETLQSIQTVVADIQAKILPNVERSMQSFENTMFSLEAMSKNYQKSSPEWASKVSSILRNVDQISVRAKAAIDDISASPWRLLYRPTDREIAYEQLNAASWQLLTALSDLRESAEALESASLASDAPADASRIAASLSESATAFEQARDAIIERMNVDFPDRN
ncbi:MAG: MlaD family protein [Phycisphaerales bacterium]|nr:MlaD family protein [Phycisphaerales bacterium]